MPIAYSITQQHESTVRRQQSVALQGQLVYSPRQRLGMYGNDAKRPERAIVGVVLLPLQGACILFWVTQGVALGYVVLGFQPASYGMNTAGRTTLVLP